MSCYVYIMEMEVAELHRRDDVLKVGISSSPGGRLASFQTANPYPVRIVSLWRFPTRDDALWVERKFHQENHMEKFRGEWFRGPYPGAADMLLMLCGRCWVEKHKRSLDGLPDWLRSCGIDEQDTIDYVVGEMPAFVDDYEGDDGE